jgi:predicted RNase H-like nuclease
VLVHEDDREFVMRPAASVEFWSGEVRELWDGITLLRLGGHFPGAQVLHTTDGKLLTGDVVATRPGGKWVSFMYSFPMLIPLPAREVERIAAALEPWEFDRIYGGWWGSVIREHAKDVVRRSAERYARAVTVGLDDRAEVRVAGVDMAGGAWAVVVLEGSRIVDAFRCDSFSEALLVDAKVIAVDVPIGIPEKEPREADAEARRFVGPRASSVFTTPVRSALEAATYAEARGVATDVTGKSLSAQSYALRKRILEVDEYAQRDERVIEVHPEVSFRELARRPIPSKHRAEGLVERRRLLVEAGIELPEYVARVAEPDLLDATIAAWTARRYARGEAVPLPAGRFERIGAIWR